MAKTYKNLFPQIISFENLLRAAKNAQKGKRKRPSVQNFHFHLEKELFDLQASLADQSYLPEPHYSFYIYDPKKRLISASAYRDRVVHHAVCQVIQPIFEKSLIFDTYANRKGKGTHKAIRRCQDFLRKNTYYLKADIAQYFPSIDHAVIKQQIRKKIACTHTLWLIDTIIDVFHQDLNKGLPIGNLTSQYLANTYLDDFDHFVKEELQCRYYIRYVDDFVIFAQDKNFLHQAKDKIQSYLQENLKLTLHKHKTKVSQTKEGISFLGQRIFTDYRLLKKPRLRMYCQQLNQKITQYQNNTLPFEQLQSSVNAWIGHALHADTFHLQKQIKETILTERIGLEKAERFAWRLLEQQR